LSEVAVRGSEAGAIEQKHETKKRMFRRKRLSKVEKALFVLLFLLWKKERILKTERIFASF
jgi:hypothetical protein